MADRPILFSGPMVRAIIEGQKTQTRRIIKPRRHASLFDGSWADSYVLDPGNQSWRDEEIQYRVGDRLWVREAWNIAFSADLAPGERIERSAEECVASNRGFACACGDGIVYRATGTRQHPEHGKALWRPSIHMPRWASRLTLIVTDMRVQRLQDISEDDAEAEGIPAKWTCLDPGTGTYAVVQYARDGFSVLWDSLAKPGTTWADNPWLVAITFDTHHCNIDAMEGRNG